MGKIFWLPVPVAWLTSRFSRPGKLVLAWPAALTAPVPLRATALDQPISQHCIA